MRPTPSELATGLRRTLREVVGPAVSDDYAAAQLYQVASVLGRFDWDGAVFDVLHANRRLAELLPVCLEWVDDDAARCRQFAGTADALRQLIDGAAALAALPASFAEADDLHHRAAGALDEVVGALASWLAEHPDDEGAGALRRRIWDHLAGGG